MSRAGGGERRLKVESGVKDNAETMRYPRFAECGKNRKKKGINTEFTEGH